MSRLSIATLTRSIVLTVRSASHVGGDGLTGASIVSLLLLAWGVRTGSSSIAASRVSTSGHSTIAGVVRRDLGLTTGSVGGGEGQVGGWAEPSAAVTLDGGKDGQDDDGDDIEREEEPRQPRECLNGRVLSAEGFKRGWKLK